VSIVVYQTFIFINLIKKLFKIQAKILGSLAYDDQQLSLETWLMNILDVYQIFLTLFQNPIVSVVDEVTSSLDSSIIPTSSSPGPSVVSFLG